MSESERPALPHLTTEFLQWLWWASERDEGRMDLGEEGGIVDVWVDQRLSFRGPGEDRARAVLTGENPSAALEARAALAGGKIVQDLQIGLRREGREYAAILRGPHLDVAAAKLPTECKGGEDEVLYERMFLYEDLFFVIRGLYRRFAAERTSPEWASVHLPAMRTWAAIGLDPAAAGASGGGEFDPDGYGG